jgi:hypothetical protein
MDTVNAKQETGRPDLNEQWVRCLKFATYTSSRLSKLYMYFIIKANESKLLDSTIRCSPIIVIG